MTVPTRYRHIGLALARASTDGGDVDVPVHVDLSDPVSVTRDGRAWLAATWARGQVREALQLASPALASRIDQLLSAGASSEPARLRGVIASAATYLLRWQRRATPFGLFAGVLPVGVGPAAAKFGTGHRVLARADAEWLTLLIERIEEHPGLRRRLTVVADQTGTVRDGRLLLSRRAGVGARLAGPLRETSVGLSRPVRAVLEAAASPIRFDALAAHLTTGFPAVSPSAIDALLGGLVEEGVLITGLRPSMTATDPLAYLFDALRAADADQLPDLVDLLDRLDQVSEELTRHNTGTEVGRAAAIRSSVAGQMRALQPGAELQLAVDVRVDGTISVPEPVLAEAALAASVLLRLSTQPFGSPAWLDYHARFRARYGPGALVPVRELVADSGLGYPGGYLGAPRARPAWRMLTERDAAFLTLIQKAALHGAAEIELTDADVKDLTVGEHDDVVPPQRVELGVTLHAGCVAAVDSGDFELWVTAAPRACTSMAGRFAPLLDDVDRARLATTYTNAEQPGDEDVVAVQLSFRPRRAHNENVVRVPRFLPDVVSLSEHPDGPVIDVNDLAVTADAAQFYLVQRSTGRRVVARIPHALDVTVHSPVLARFLAEVTDARSAVFGGFDPGAARVLPYVPRIRYRRTVLAAARWILTTADLPHMVGGAWGAGLDAWQQRWRVPDRVVLCDGELRLPLDLGQRLDRAVLQARLNRAERIELREDAPADSYGWAGRPVELLFPMTAISPPTRRLPVTAAPGTVLRPGSATVLHAQLVGNPARFDEILTRRLPAFVDELGALVERWWVRRHRDMIHVEADQYLAVALRLAGTQAYPEVAERLAAFAADLHTRGLPADLALVSSPQHPGRYGEGRVLLAAEQVFAADTAAAIAQITLAEQAGLPGQAVAAASMTHLAAGFAPDPVSGYRALLECLKQQTGRLDRKLREHALALAGEFQAVCALPDGEAVAAAWLARDSALSAYHQALAVQRDPGTVLRTLLHEHHIRAVGVDPQFEDVTGRLARIAALRRLALAGAL